MEFRLHVQVSFERVRCSHFIDGFRENVQVLIDRKAQRLRLIFRSFRIVARWGYC